MAITAALVLTSFAAALALAACPAGRAGGAARLFALSAAAALLPPRGWSDGAIVEAAWSPWKFLDVLPLRFRLDGPAAAWSALALAIAAALSVTAAQRRVAGSLAFAALGAILAERFDTALAFDALALPGVLAALANASPAAGMTVALRFLGADVLLASAAFGRFPPETTMALWAVGAALRIAAWPLQGWLTEGQRQAPGAWAALPLLSGVALLSRATSTAALPTGWGDALLLAAVAAAALAHGHALAAPRLAALLSAAAAFGVARRDAPIAAILGVAALAAALPHRSGPRWRGDRWSFALGAGWFGALAWSVFAAPRGAAAWSDPAWRGTFAAAALGLLALPAWATAAEDDGAAPREESWRRFAFAVLAAGAAAAAFQGRVS